VRPSNTGLTASIKISFFTYIFAVLLHQTKQQWEVCTNNNYIRGWAGLANIFEHTHRGTASLPLIIVYVHTKFEVYCSNGSVVMADCDIQDDHHPPFWILRFCHFRQRGPLPLIIVNVHTITKREVSSSNGSKVMANCRNPK
jgi:hypothetical protein